MRPTSITVSLHAWSVITVLLILGVPVSVRSEGKIWVLLMAGSKGYDNYGIQGDICHAYQAFSAHGVPDEQIVVMMFDDIAYNDWNPYPGEIINEPGGPNVYTGVPKDYTQNNVNKDVVFAVLHGDHDRVYKLTGYHGKVIDSGPEDYVFVYFDSHGSRGFIAMPQSSDVIYASELNDALQEMHLQKRFAKLLFYMDSCNAGSMFEDLLPEDMDVYAVTGADPEEYSYMCFFDDERDVWLSSFFVYSWLHNCDTADLRKETLQEQFDIIVEGTEKSHPQQYGDLSFTSWPVSEFMDSGDEQPMLKANVSRRSPFLVIPKDEMEVFILRQLLADPRQESRHEELRTELEEKLWLQAQTDLFFSNFVNAAVLEKDFGWALNTPLAIKQRSAYEYAVDYLMAVCPRLSPADNLFVLRKMDILVNLTNGLSLSKVLAAFHVAAVTSPLCYN